jgi:all-trans-8'-apo-beta-carotenal 15,15'-oxygenase
VPIDAPERAQRIRSEAFFAWHFANAFERGDEIVVDFVRHADVGATATMRSAAADGGGVIDMDEGRLCRAVIDPATGRVRFETTFDARCEFPTIDPRGAGGERRFVWLTAAHPESRSIARVDLRHGSVSRWVPDRAEHVSEPVFAPRAGGSDDETDGYVLVLVFDERADASHVAVLDARAPERGPLARVHFDHPVPLTLHGGYVESGGA